MDFKGIPSPSTSVGLGETSANEAMAKTGGSEPLFHPQPQSLPHYQGYHGSIPAPAAIQEPLLYEQPYILLPLYRRTRSRRRDGSGGFCRGCDVILTSSSLLFFGVSLFLLASAAFVLWPSDPKISIARLGLDHVSIVTDPAPSLDIAMDLRIRLRNPDFFSLDYHSIVVSLGYRGKLLGSVKSDVGHVRARGVSYIDAKLRLDGIQVINDAFYLIEDLARGYIPLDTVTEVQGKLNFFFLDLPIKGRISCSVRVNPEDQTVTRQECYPE